MKDCIIIHYSEIGTKGKNRKDFENRLVQNIKGFLKDYDIGIYKRYGRLVCNVRKRSLEKIREIVEIIKNVPGISYVAPCSKTSLDISGIKKKAYDIISLKDFETFKVVAQRSNKSFELNSKQINEQVGDHLVRNLGKKVSIRNPEEIVYVEVSEKAAFVYDEKFYGVGGLPIGAAGKVISSLSGGIDSPVSSYMMMKRGCEVVFGHVENQSLSKRKVKNKIEKLVKCLSKFQRKSKLYIIPFEEIQKQITIFVPSRYRMIVYRRFMLRILNEIAKKEKAKAIVTGDSVSQVASQTLENINSIYSASDLPVISPLVGMNKQESIDLSKKIGTYETSIMPYPDCCSFMVPKQPETESSPDLIEEVEQKIEDKEGLIDRAVKGSEVREIAYHE